MKVLLLYATHFAYKTTVKTLDDFPDIDDEQDFSNVQLAFIQLEEKDEVNLSAVEKKLVKNLKWILRKNDSNRIILHSFAHLSESKADARITKDFFDAVELRLKNANYEVEQTPFGYFLDLNIAAPGFSTARVFKDI